MHVCLPASRHQECIGYSSAHNTHGDGEWISHNITSMAKKVAMQSFYQIKASEAWLGIKKSREEVLFLLLPLPRVEWREEKEMHRLIAYTHVKTKVETLETAMRMELNHPPELDLNIIKFNNSLSCRRLRITEGSRNAFAYSRV